MNLVLLAIIAIVASVAIIGWDAASRRRQLAPGNLQVTEGNDNSRRHLAELAYYVLFIASLGLMLKVMSFAAVLLLATTLTGLVWLWSALTSKNRPAGQAEPMGVELARGFFPVILIVFAVRSFLVEPFKIPSGSMIPTLLVGDFILVNKFTYGIRLPVINSKIVEMNQPKRGEVMVFRYPVDPSLDYIKRVIGVPGDRVEYRDKRLSINGMPVPIESAGSYGSVESGLQYSRHDLFRERLGVANHIMMTDPEAPSIQLAGVRQFPSLENCAYNEAGFTCTVPAGHYFMMGDNRDGSSDSRYWGFVPEQNIVGKAFFIWWNFGEFKRIGSLIN